MRRTSALWLVAALLALAAAQPVNVPLPSPEKIPAGTLVAQYRNPDVRVYSVSSVVSQDFQGLKVTAGRVSRTFPKWRAISNPTFWPALDVKDVTGDGKPEALITLMTDEGTGVAVYDQRVLTLPDLRELPVAPPVAGLRQRVKFGVRQLVVNGQAIPLKLPEGEFKGPATIGDHVRWSVRGGRLTAEVEVQQTWAFVGRLLLSYRFAGGQLVPDKVAYDPKELK